MRKQCKNECVPYSKLKNLFEVLNMEKNIQTDSRYLLQCKWSKIYKNFLIMVTKELIQRIIDYYAIIDKRL